MIPTKTPCDLRHPMSPPLFAVHSTGNKKHHELRRLPLSSRDVRMNHKVPSPSTAGRLAEWRKWRARRVAGSPIDRVSLYPRNLDSARGPSG